MNDDPDTPVTDRGPVDGPATGGRLTAEDVLAGLPPGWHVVRNIRIPKTKARIDGIVIGPTGIRVVRISPQRGTLTYRDAMLWRGRRSIRPEIERLEWMTRVVTYSVGAAADPVLCMPYAVTPRSAQMIGRTRVVSPDALHQLLTTGIRIYGADEVSRLSHLADDVKSPSVLPQASPVTTSRRSRPSAFGPLRELVLITALIAALAVLGVGLALTNRAPRTTEVVSSVPEPPTSTVSCPAPGAGWTVTFRRSVPPTSPAVYRFTAEFAGTRHELRAWSIMSGDPPAVTRVSPATTVTLEVRTSDRFGTSTTTRTTSTPAAEC